MTRKSDDSEAEETQEDSAEESSDTGDMQDDSEDDDPEYEEIEDSGVDISDNEEMQDVENSSDNDEAPDDDVVRELFANTLTIHMEHIPHGLVRWFVLNLYSKVYEINYAALGAENDPGNDWVIDCIRRAITEVGRPGFVIFYMTDVVGQDARGPPAHVAAAEGS
ncbi:hypothetical protein SLS59_002374 [Nothophoma quercina]|uniref:Uncharacterized protein n=1 Tax=Nothophoma quercina TaxID=749835 RepID=A0ABR3RTX7_9PLEO